MLKIFRIFFLPIFFFGVGGYRETDPPQTQKKIKCKKKFCSDFGELKSEILYYRLSDIIEHSKQKKIRQKNSWKINEMHPPLELKPSPNVALLL